MISVAAFTQKGKEVKLIVLLIYFNYISDKFWRGWERRDKIENW